MLDLIILDVWSDHCFKWVAVHTRWHCTIVSIGGNYCTPCMSLIGGKYCTPCMSLRGCLLECCSEWRDVSLPDKNSADILLLLIVLVTSHVCFIDRLPNVCQSCASVLHEALAFYRRWSLFGQGSVMYIDKRRNRGRGRAKVYLQLRVFLRLILELGSE